MGVFWETLGLLMLLCAIWFSIAYVAQRWLGR